MTKQKFIPLNKVLLENNEEVIIIKTLKQREEEYAYLLGPIEHTIALHYSGNGKLKDRDVVKILKNIKMNYFKDLGYFKEPLEQELIIQLSLALQETKTTRHEFLLAISYILWSIDNRTWTGDNKAYIDWILNFFGMMDREEKKKFANKYHELGKRFGIDEGKIKTMIAGADELDDYDVPEISEDDEKWSFEESKYFSMSDEEKCNYFLKCKDKEKSVMALKELMELAEAYLQNNEFEKSLKILDKLLFGNLEQNLRELVSSLRIECFICLKDYEIAEKGVEELIKLNKDYPMAYFNRAVILFKKGDLTKALEVIDTCIQIAESVDMRHPQFYMMKADILKKQNNDDYKRFEDMAKAVDEENTKKLKQMAEENEINLEDFDF